MIQLGLPITFEYDLVLESHQLQLIEEVRKRITDGWRPLGGISTWEGYLCQAMIREGRATESRGEGIVSRRWGQQMNGMEQPE